MKDSRISRAIGMMIPTTKKRISAAVITGLCLPSRIREERPPLPPIVAYDFLDPISFWLTKTEMEAIAIMIRAMAKAVCVFCDLLFIYSWLDRVTKLTFEPR